MSSTASFLGAFFMCNLYFDAQEPKKTPQGRGTKGGRRCEQAREDILLHEAAINGRGLNVKCYG